jgi:hypothetical protein
MITQLLIVSNLERAELYLHATYTLRQGQVHIYLAITLNSVPLVKVSANVVAYMVYSVFQTFPFPRNLKVKSLSRTW